MIVYFMMAKRKCDVLIDASGDYTGADVAFTLRSSQPGKKGRGKSKKPGTVGRQKATTTCSTLATERESVCSDQQSLNNDDAQGSSLRKDDISLIVSEVLKELRKDSSEGSSRTEESDDAPPGM